MTQREQVELTFNIINSIGSLATFGAFILLFFKDKDKQKQIEKLNSIAKILGEQNHNLKKQVNLSVAPILWLNGAGTTDNTELKIDLNNKGERAILDDLTLKSGDFQLHSKSVPWDLEKDDHRFIFARYTGNKSINESEYEIEVLYHDNLNNKFRLEIAGKGSHVKIKSNLECLS
ncbi:hypothetical protein GZH53_12975 [Flavihumibacter sp. R14]|nr:hypothetical protein [Flavihumibacter soli]